MLVPECPSHMDTRGMSCVREGYISVDFHLEERAFSSYFTMLFDNKDVP